MSMKDMVRADFEEFIRLDPLVPEGLRGSLRLRERVPQFVDNLARELSEAEAQGITFDRYKIKEIVYSLSKLFVGLLKTRADEMEMSDIAKTAARRALEGDPIKQKFDKDGNADLSDEFGIIIKDK